MLNLIAYCQSDDFLICVALPDIAMHLFGLCIYNVRNQLVRDCNHSALLIIPCFSQGKCIYLLAQDENGAD